MSNKKQASITVEVKDNTAGRARPDWLIDIEQRYHVKSRW